jgi:peptide subunit release factor 1 (eRF1)
VKREYAGKNTITRSLMIPADRALHDFARDIREIQDQLMNIESILNKLLKSKEKDL